MRKYFWSLRGKKGIALWSLTRSVILQEVPTIIVIYERRLHIKVQLQLYNFWSCCLCLIYSVWGLFTWT